MQDPDTRIQNFIREHHVLTIATAVEDIPYCANCFYVYLEEENLFVFTSDHDTRHAVEFQVNNQVAGSVVLETRVVGKIQGLQFTGRVEALKGDILKKAKSRYLRKFPVALLMKTSLWGVKPEFMKMTHNALGFGKKLIWSSKEGSSVHLAKHEEE